VHKHERAYEDVAMVGEAIILFPFGTEANGRLVEFHPTRACLRCRFAWEGKTHDQHGDHQELEQHDWSLSEK